MTISVHYYLLCVTHLYTTDTKDGEQERERERVRKREGNRDVMKRNNKMKMQESYNVDPRVQREKTERASCLDMACFIYSFFGLSTDFRMSLYHDALYAHGVFSTIASQLHYC